MSSSPPSTESPDSTKRRFLIAAGTAEYDFLEPESWLPEVKEAVRSVAELFTKKLGYERVLPGLGESPTVGELREGLSNWFAAKERQASDLVVIYYSGHGETCEDDHVLLARDSDLKNLAGTSLASGDLARFLANSPAQQILLVLDTCQAGRGGEDFAAKASRVIRNLRRDDHHPSGLYVIAAAGPKEEASPGVFTKELVSVIERVPLSVAGAGPPYLSLDAVVGEIKKRFLHSNVPQSVSFNAVRVNEVVPFFCNPRYVPVQSRVDAGELRDHFGPRSRSVEAEPHPGSYFTGRVAALSKLVAWLTASAATAPRARVLTGRAGSGKSAVLSRLVTLSLPDYRWRVPLDGVPKETIPPENLVDVAVLASRKSLADCVAGIARAAGVEADRPGALFEALAEWGGRRADGRVRVVLFDALDESIEPLEVARELLRPLARIPSVRLLAAVGGGAVPKTQPDLINALGSAFDVLDLDDPQYAPKEDFVEYITRRLLAENDPNQNTPYRGRPDLARKVGDAVSRHAYPVFLVARLMCDALVEADEPVDITGQDQETTFPAAVHDAFDKYLDRFGSDKTLVVDLLRPLAYAEGAGLPFGNLWAPLASAIADQKYTDGRVEWLLGRVSAFVIEAVEDGRSVYRLYHQALAEHLRSNLQAIEHQRRITRALTGGTPDSPDGGGNDWLSADPYIHRHLAAHAAAAGELAKLVASPGYLVAAEPGGLVRAMRHHSQPLPPEIVRVYQGASHHLHGSSFAERASYLEMVARQNELNDLADKFDRVVSRRPFSVLWAHWQPEVAHLTIPGHEEAIMSVAIGQVEGVPVVVSGGYDSTVRLWNPETGVPFGKPLPKLDGPIQSVAMGEVDGLSVVASVGSGGTVRLWSPTTGELRIQPDLTVGSMAVGRLMGRMVLAAGTSDGLVLLSLGSLSDSQVLGKPLVHDDEIRSIAMGECKGRTLIVTGTDNGTLRLWWIDADGSEAHLLWSKPSGAGTVTISGKHGTMSTFYGMVVALGELENRLVVVSPGSEGTLRLWDVDSGEPVGKPWRAHDHGVYSLAVGKMKGGTVIVSGGSDGTVKLWDMASRQPVCEPMTGHDGAVYSVSVGEVKGHTVIASGGSDKTVRLWDPDPGTGRPPERGSAGQPGPVHSLAVAEVFGHTVVASGGNDGAVRLWKPDSGQAIGQSPFHNENSLFSMAAGKQGGQTVFALGISAGMVNLWDPETGRSMRRFLMDHGNMAESIAMAELEGQPVIVALGGDGTLWLWKLAPGGILSQPCWVRSIRSSRMALGTLKGRTVIATADSNNDRAVKLRHLATGEVFRELPPSHGTSVISLALSDLNGRDCLISGSNDGSVSLTDLTNSEPRCERLRQPLRGWDQYVRSVAVGRSDDESVIVTGGDAGAVGIYSLSGRKEMTIHVGAGVRSAAILPDGVIVPGGCLVLQVFPSAVYDYGSS